MLKKTIAVLCALMLVALCVSCAKEPAENHNGSDPETVSEKISEKQDDPAQKEEKSEHNEKKPAKEEPAEKPQKEEPAEKPQNEEPAEKPQKEEPAEKPQKEEPAEKPHKDEPAEKPSVSHSGGAKDKFDHGEKPSYPVSTNKVNNITGKDLLIHVEDRFSISGRPDNVVVKGTVIDGSVKIGDTVKLYYDIGRENYKLVIVEDITMFHRPLDEAEKGDHIDLLLSGIKASEKLKINIGSSIISPNSHYVPARKYAGVFTVLDNAPNAVTSAVTKFQVDVVYGYSYQARFDTLGHFSKGDVVSGCFIFTYKDPILYVGQKLRVTIDGIPCGEFLITDVNPVYTGV